MKAGNFSAADTIALRGIEAGIEHPFLFKVHAFWLHNNGNHSEALRQFHHARTLDPQDPSILNGLAGCLTALGQYAAALDLIDIALAALPNVATNHFLRGWILEQAGDFPQAKSAYLEAVKLAPNDPNILAALAAVSLQIEDFETAREKSIKALSLDPGHLTAIKTLAATDIACGQPQDAETRLRTAMQAGLAPNIRAQFLSVLGNAYDAQDNTPQAFATWQQKVKEAHHHAHAPGDPLIEFARSFNTISPETWREDRSTFSNTPAFLCGPSNDLLLGALPKARRLTGSLAALANEHLANPSALESLASLRGDDVEDLRASYWQKVGETSGQIPIECNARYPLDLPLIAKLFPYAKVIVIIRDPRDSVIDAFRSQTGGEDGAIYPLEDCATAYATIHSFAALCKERLPVNIMEVRLEDMAADTTETAQKIAAFLGTEAQSTITPTYLKKSIGAWRRYKEQMTAAGALLAEQVKDLNYSVD